MAAKHESMLLNTWSGVLADVSDPVCITTAKGTPIFLNVAFQRLTGYQDLESFGMAGGLENNISFEKTLEENRAKVINGRDWQGDVQVRLKSGKYVYLHLSIKSLKNGTEEVVGLCYLFKSYALSINPSGYHKLLEYFVDHANDAVMITEAEPINEPGPRIVYVNPAFCRITGYSKDEMLGTSPRKLQGPKTDRQQLDKIREALLARQPLKVELVNYRKNGEEFWVDFSLVPVFTKNGGVSHFVSIQRETTQKKQLEQSLIESQIHLQQVINASEDVLKHSLDIICSINQEGHLLKVNPAFERILGYKPHDIQNLHFSAFMHPEDVEKTIQALQTLLINKTLEGFENRLIHKEGKVIHMIWDVSWSEDQQLVYSIGRDISIQKKIQRQLKESEQLYKSVVENFPDGNISIINRSYVLEFIVGKGLETLGMVPEDFIGKSFWDIQDSDTAKRTVEALAPTFSGQHCSLELTFADRFYKCLTVPLYEGSEINRFMMVSLDISAAKEAEEKLQRYALQLEKTNSELDQLVYKTSHDLRAPLVSILGLINITLAEQDEQVRKEYLGLMAKSIKKLDAFILDIISFSKSARAEVVNEKVDFPSLIKDVIDGLKFMEEAQTIAFQLQLEPVNGFYSDRKRIEVVLHNIIANAIRYKDPRKENSYIRIKQSNIDPGKMQLSIEDNGIGIGKEHQEKIFNMFYRATDANVGSGLGLYIVKENLNKLNGKIKVNSVPGVGTSFHITLPSLKT